MIRHVLRGGWANGERKGREATTYCGYGLISLGGAAWHRYEDGVKGPAVLVVEIGQTLPDGDRYCANCERAMSPRGDTGGSE